MAAIRSALTGLFIFFGLAMLAGCVPSRSENPLSSYTAPAGSYIAPPGSSATIEGLLDETGPLVANRYTYVASVDGRLVSRPAGGKTLLEPISVTADSHYLQIDHIQGQVTGSLTILVRLKENTAYAIRYAYDEGYRLNGASMMVWIEDKRTAEVVGRKYSLRAFGPAAGSVVVPIFIR